MKISPYLIHPINLSHYLTHPINIKGGKDKVNDELRVNEIIWFNS